MDFEKAYKEALERAKAGKPLDEVFPELKESEDERIRKQIERALIEHDWSATYNVSKDDCLAYLERQKEQKPAESGAIKGGDFISDGKRVFLVLANVKERNLGETGSTFCESHILGVDGVVYCDGDDFKKFKRATSDERAKFIHDLKVGVELKEQPAEWSEEDEKIIDEICGNLDYLLHNTICAEQTKVNLENRIKWLIRLKSLRPQPKEEREHMEIKYGGKIYQVHGMRALPGGASGYIIEDEPGHYDCIMNPEEVLGGGYGVKQNGSPYPTKEATFDLPHWKPSEEQMNALEYFIRSWGESGTMSPQNTILCAAKSLYTDLQNYFSL